MRLIAWAVPQNILVAQLCTDFSGNIGQLIQVFNGKRAPTRQLCHFRQQRRPIELLKGSAAVLVGVENANGIQLGICFSN